jgi:protein required for attachment to host cells
MIDKTKTWALVMNSTIARILRGFRTDGFIPPAELVMKSPHRNLREIMADKQGRAFASHGGGRRSAMEYRSNPLQEDLRAFVRRAVDDLDAHYLAGDFTALAIFAEPTVLGMLREELTERLSRRTMLEVPLNLAHLGEADLARKIEAELRAV